MTRNEFLEDVTDFGELKDFCDNEGIYVCDGVMDGEYFDEIIMDRIQERGYFDTWQEVYRFLRDLPDGAAYYIENDYGEINEATDDDFEELKQEVLEYMDERDRWEPEGEDDEDDTADAPGNEAENGDDIITYRLKPLNKKEEPDEVEITAEEFAMMLRKAG